MKYTPGPWFDNRSTKSIKQFFRFDDPNKRPDFDICRYPTRTEKSIVSHDEWEGNARLIATAPELYEACRLVLDSGELGSNLEGVLSKAISKAEGK